MPSTETIVTGATPDSKIAEMARSVAVEMGGVLLPNERDEHAYFKIKVIFGDRAVADRYNGFLLTHGIAGTWSFLTPKAVKSWVGNYARVRIGGGVGSLYFEGRIEFVPGDDSKIRVIPRAKFEGLDMGPSTYGSPSATDSSIDRIIDILPA